jgi:RHS repeat-associated protein
VKLSDPAHQAARASGYRGRGIYLYTADGERISDRDTLAGTTTLTVRGLDAKVLRIYGKSGSTWSWTKDYVYQQGWLLASVDATGTRYFALDHLGTVRRITGTGTPAQVLASHDYYPFGSEASSTTQDTERMRFTGQECDLMGTSSQTDDLCYMHARFYNPNIGRFLSTDLLRGDPYHPQSFNLFAYVQNNPTNYTDPWGLTDERTTVYAPDPCPEVPAGFSCSGWYGLMTLLRGSLNTSLGGLARIAFSQLAALPRNLQDQNCGAFGGGFGFSLNANADYAVGPMGLNGAIAGGWGAFYDSDSGSSEGLFATGTALAFNGGTSYATPPQTMSGNVVAPRALGMYGGVGLTVFGTNAHSVRQLSGHATLYQLNVGLPGAKASMSLALGENDIVAFSASVVPGTGSGIGFSATRYVTDTTTTKSGCR